MYQKKKNCDCVVCSKKPNETQILITKIVNID